MTDRDVRAVTASIAAGYDLVPYNPGGIGSPGLDPVYLFGLAALHGAVPLRQDIDVLDLGCGGGGQLLRVAAQCTGRVVGIDFSAAACAEARARSAGLGPRCQILQADLLDLDADSLGSFDLVYLVGVFYVVPQAVQARLLEVLSRVLKPGGIAVISYYSPEIWRAIDALRRSIAAAVDTAAPPAAVIAAARAHVKELVRTGQGGIPALITNHALTCDEPTFFHEMFGPILAPVSATALENALGPSGIHFLNWMMPGAFADLSAPRARAHAADALPGGGYHYAVFAKGDAIGGVAAAWDQVHWQTRLRRAGTSRSGHPVFTDPASGQGLDIPNPATARALDRLAGGPLPWRDIQQAMSAAPASDSTAVKRDFLSLWLAGALTPLWVPGPSI